MSPTETILRACLGGLVVGGMLFALRALVLGLWAMGRGTDGR